MDFRILPFLLPGHCYVFPIVFRIIIVLRGFSGTLLPTMTESRGAITFRSFFAYSLKLEGSSGALNCWFKIG